MQNIIDIASGMKQSEFISAVNNNFKYLNMGADLTAITAANANSDINTNFQRLNAKIPFTDSMDSVSNGMGGADYINAIKNNFTKIKSAETLKNVGAKLIIRFDDGYAGQYSGWFPLLESLEVKGVIAALAEHYATNHSGMTTNSSYFTWTKALEMIDAGWDIDCHGLIYTDVYTSSIAYNESVLKSAYDTFVANGITPIHFHVHSSSNYNPKTIALELAVRRYFKASNLWFNGVVNEENIDLFNLQALTFDGSVDAGYNISNQSGIDAFHSLFLSMTGTNKACIIVGHDYSAGLGTALTTVINDAKSQGIEIVTMTEFYNGLVKV
jgi:hypothetical protein